MLTERHHAFISASFYRELERSGIANFRDIFLFATRKYAEERGSRMAQRALRDGRELDFASYRWYGEWQYTPQFLAEVTGEASERYEDSGDLFTKIHICPWSAQYLDMELLGGAEAYCSVLDESLARGFNPALKFTVSHTMHAQRDYCLQCQHDAKVGHEAAFGERKPENIRDFDYHCAHVYSTFCRYISAICGETGERVCARVLEAFGAQYGQDAARVLKDGLTRDYTVI